MNSNGVSSHAPPTMPKTGGSALFSPSLPFSAGGDTHVTCKRTKNASKTVDFNFFLSFSDLFFFCPSSLRRFGSAPLCFAFFSVGILYRLQVVRGRWSYGGDGMDVRPGEEKRWSDQRAKKKWHLRLKRETVGLSPVEDGRSPTAVVRGSCYCRLLG